MTTKSIRRIVLVCDRCSDIEDGGGVGFENKIEAQAAGYNAGWRFPAKAEGRGYEDVCLSCITEQVSIVAEPNVFDDNAGDGQWGDED